MHECRGLRAFRVTQSAVTGTVWPDVRVRGVQRGVERAVASACARYDVYACVYPRCTRGVQYKCLRAAGGLARRAVVYR